MQDIMGLLLCLILAVAAMLIFQPQKEEEDE